MKNLKCILFSAVFLFGTLSAAGGVVGSGAGFVEMNFQFVYDSLSAWIESCQRENICETAERQGQLFSGIREITKQNRSRPDRLQFLSGSANPEKFNTGVNEPDRIATTGLDPQSVIFVNVDQLYSAETSLPTLGIPEIAGILVHEVGHQTGESSHELLNLMAAQIRIYLNRTSQIYSFEVGAAPEQLQMTVVNQRQPLMMSTMGFNWQNRYSIDLTGKVFQLARCQEGQSLSGYELFNGYFLLNSVQADLVEFNFWMKLTCFDPTLQKLSSERWLLQVTLSPTQLVDLKHLQ